MTVPSPRDQRGQSSVELVALLPLALLLGLAVMAVLGARATAGEAATAAQAGAMALIQDADGEDAARAALPARARRHARIDVRGDRVTVTLRSTHQLPFVGRAPGATASASAGPEKAP